MTAQNPSTAPIDRSISRQMMTAVVPIARAPITANWTDRLLRLIGEMKRGVVSARTIHKIMSGTMMPEVRTMEPAPRATRASGGRRVPIGAHVSSFSAAEPVPPGASPALRFPLPRRLREHELQEIVRLQTRGVELVHGPPLRQDEDPVAQPLPAPRTPEDTSTTAVPSAASLRNRR